MRVKALVFVGVVASALVFQSAGAWAGAGKVLVWPGSVITYRDVTGAPQFHSAVVAAVKAWNRLNLGVVLEPVPARANVRISLAAGRCLRGRGGAAPVGFRSTGSQIVLSRSCPLVVQRLLVAHELGRALGLPADNRRCSLMNSRAVSDGLTYVVPAKCSRSRPPGWIRSLIDPATVALARLMYRPPRPPGAIGLTVTAEGVPQVGWVQGSDTTAARTVVARTAGTCPTDRQIEAGTAFAVFDGAASAGSHAVVDARFPVTGTRCYRAFDLNRFGRVADSPNAISYVSGGPIAGFTVSSPVAGTPASFTDVSTVPSGMSISHWTWHFGNPRSGAANVVNTSDPTVGTNPSHVYAKAGTYNVTLTVTDTAGLASSMTEQVVVAS